MPFVAVYVVNDGSLDAGIPAEIDEFLVRHGWLAGLIAEDEGDFEQNYGMDLLPMGLARVVDAVERGIFDMVVISQAQDLGHGDERFLTNFVKLKEAGADVFYVNEPDDRYGKLMDEVIDWLDDMAYTPRTGRRTRSPAEYRRVVELRRAQSSRSGL